MFIFYLVSALFQIMLKYIFIILVNNNNSDATIHNTVI